MPVETVTYYQVKCDNAGAPDCAMQCDAPQPTHQGAEDLAVAAAWLQLTIDGNDDHFFCPACARIIRP